jgi:hypothetical protein
MSQESVDANMVRVSDDGSQLLAPHPPWISNLQKELGAQH